MKYNSLIESTAPCFYFTVFTYCFQHFYTVTSFNIINVITNDNNNNNNTINYNIFVLFLKWIEMYSKWRNFGIIKCTGRCSAIMNAHNYSSKGHQHEYFHMK